MNITKQNIDALNAVVKVDIVQKDYQEKVTKILNDYRKNANIPGFRKGHVPMGMIKKQYGKSAIIDQVNKLLQENLNKFLINEKIDILGNPLPRYNKDFNWNSDNFSFEFELGLAPEFSVDIKGKNKIIKYKIIATDELLNKEVENIQKRYGKIISLNEVTELSNVTGTFENKEENIEKKSTLIVNDLKNTKDKKKLINCKVGDIIELETKNLFDNNNNLQNILGVSNENSKNLDIKVTFTIEEITTNKPADLNEELFKKLFSDGSVKTIDELKNKIKEDSEKQFQNQADQQLLNSVIEHFIDNTNFDLPRKFLEKWLKTSGEKELTEEQAKIEYEKSEKALRYQLIESKIMKDNNIKTDYSELQNFTKEFVKTQLAQFGNTNPNDDELNNITTRILKNKEETQRIQNKLISKKLLTFYKENMKLKSKKVNYDEFIKEVTNSNK